MESTWKHRLLKEMAEVGLIFLMILLFLLMFATFRMMLLDSFSSKYFLYGTAIINAGIFAKVVAIGEMAHLGRRAEDRALIVSVLWKAFAFSLLVIAFELLEDNVKGYFHGEVVFHKLDPIRRNELIARTVVAFLAFIPFFAFRELSRVVGHRRTLDLFFKNRRESWPDQAPACDQAARAS